MRARTILGALTLAAAQVVVAQDAAKIGFNRQVRPILSNKCFFCHGPDEKRREADLRLDQREGAVADLGGRAAIVPGDPDSSELLRRVESHDDGETMPPPESKRPRLTEAEVAVLRRWIAEGASYEGHWAFLPVSNPTLPPVTDAARVRNPIDRFVQARLEQEGIAPSPEAERAVLIRRVSLDLTGLLPTPEEVDAFANDPDPDAYDKLVDRLLASPHYGERWGRHWLDQARYADSNGYTIDGDRAMWPYRDWVIKSLNDDLPFDRFTIEQLAGDLLPAPTKNQLVATAFHRNTLINEEGGTDREQFRHEAVVDRVNTTGAVWLGLTVACAQCHTHKFDPIPHRDYYSLFAFFNGGTDVNDRGATIKVARGEVFGSPITPPPSTPDAELTEALAQWEAKQREALRQPADSPVDWLPAEYVTYDTKSGAGLQLLKDGSLLSDGRGSSNDAYRVVAKTPLNEIAAVRLRVLTDESLPKRGPGLASNGNFVLTEFRVRLGDRELPIASAFADHEQPGYPIAAAIDQDGGTGWAINVGPKATAQMNAPHEAVFAFEAPVATEGGPLEFELSHDLNEKYLVGRFGLDVSATAPSLRERLDPALIDALTLPAERRSDEQSNRVREAFLDANPKFREKKDAPSVDVADLMVMQESATPRETFVYLRGDFLRPDQETGPLRPDVLSAVAPDLPDEGDRSRLTLARWLVDPRNPLTPRVTANRIWMRYFGRGLVETEEDFGTQGSPPTHPELLDWLASEFVRQGWSQKAMHRAMVTSATYRQSSDARPELAEKDPRNLLLARQERVRVEAEIVRDAALSASGLLDRTVGGPGVRPPQPDGIYAFTQNAKRWTEASGGERYRRALYTVFYRSAPYPLFTTFDSPDFQTTCTRRLRSNTPLQALTVANDPAFREIAEGLARRVLHENSDGDVQRHVAFAFRLALSREPSVEELALLVDFHDRELRRYASDEAATRASLSKAAADEAAEPEKLAAMVSVARAILNADAFITRE